MRRAQRQAATEKAAAVMTILDLVLPDPRAQGACRCADRVV